MNTKWFRAQLADKKMSQRGLAKLLKLDAAAVSLMLRGMRRMTPEEAHDIANILGLPITEVLRQAGIKVLDDVRRVPISAAVDEDGVVSLFPARTHDEVVGPADCPAGTYGVQCRAPSLPQDGWLMYVSPAQGPADAHMDKLCVVATTKGEQLMAVVRRGYRNGTYNLLVWPNHGAVRTDQDLAWSSPVLWMKP